MPAILTGFLSSSKKDESSFKTTFLYWSIFSFWLSKSMSLIKYIPSFIDEKKDRECSEIALSIVPCHLL